MNVNSQSSEYNNKHVLQIVAININYKKKKVSKTTTLSPF